MKSIKQRIKNNNSGMALITVIVVIGFIASLVSIALTTTLVNYKMKSVNTRSKDTFYSAEQVLDEITIGLQRLVSDALSTSYIEIMNNYGEYDNDTKKQTIQIRYYERLWGELEVAGSGHNYYDVEKLESFLKSSTIWHDVKDADDNVVGGYGAIITAVNSSMDDSGEVTNTEKKYGEMVTFSDTGIVLKNIKVYYKDSNGFVSVIQTDIRLAYPDFEFAKSTLTTDIADYCFIADDGVEKTNNGTITITGNIYANDTNFKNNTVTISEEDKDDNEVIVIVKHDLGVTDGTLKSLGKTGNNGKKNASKLVVWAKNILAKSSTIDVDGKYYLSNDLNLLGKNTNVTLKGEYTGYGYNYVDPDKSSAILVNGKASELHLKDLTEFTLAGHAFLGTSSANDIYHQYTLTGDDKANGAKEEEQYKDVYTGESIAVKPDQIMYLVPAAAIGVDDGDPAKRSILDNPTNPMPKSDFVKIREKVKGNETNNTKFVYVSDVVKIPELGTSLENFIRYDGKNPLYYYHEVTVNDPEVGSLVYLYMVFDNEDMANEYARKYYNLNEAINGRYTKAYLKSIDLPKNMSVFGNVFQTANSENVENGLEMITSMSYIGAREKDSSFPDSNIMSRFNKDLRNKLDEDATSFYAYTTKLVPNKSEIAGCKIDPTDGSDMKDKTGQVVFENVASSLEVIKAFVDGISLGESGSVEYNNVTITNDGTSGGLKFVSNESGEIAIVSTSDVEVDSENIKLVITTGDVTVSSGKQKGVIISDGRITFSSSSTICEKDPEGVKRALQFGYDSDDGLFHSIASCLADGNDYIFANYSNNDNRNNTSLTGLVIYENWKKE